MEKVVHRRMPKRAPSDDPPEARNPTTKDVLLAGGKATSAFRPCAGALVTPPQRPGVSSPQPERQLALPDVSLPTSLALVPLPHATRSFREDLTTQINRQKKLTKIHVPRVRKSLRTVAVNPAMHNRGLKEQLLFPHVRLRIKNTVEIFMEFWSFDILKGQINTFDTTVKMSGLLSTA